MVNVDPLPGSLSTSTVLPIISQKGRVMANRLIAFWSAAELSRSRSSSSINCFLVFAGRSCKTRPKSCRYYDTTQLGDVQR